MEGDSKDALGTAPQLPWTDYAPNPQLESFRSITDIDTSLTGYPLSTYSVYDNNPSSYSPLEFILPHIPLERTTAPRSSTILTQSTAGSSGSPSQTCDSLYSCPSVGSSSTMHTPEVLRCEVGGCSQAFTGLYRQGNLGRHRRLVHGTGSRYICGDITCAKEFRRQDARLNHYRKYHRELAAQMLERSFPCPVCQAEQKLGSPHTCTSAPVTTLSAVRTHLTRRLPRGQPPHLPFLKLCKACNEDILDEHEFGTFHGVDGLKCDNPKPQRKGDAGQQEQYGILCSKVEAYIIRQRNLGETRTSATAVDGSTILRPELPTCNSVVLPQLSGPTQARDEAANEHSRQLPLNKQPQKSCIARENVSTLKTR